jgi:hypothetical protein
MDHGCDVALADDAAIGAMGDVRLIVGCCGSGSSANNVCREADAGAFAAVTRRLELDGERGRRTETLQRLAAAALFVQRQQRELVARRVARLRTRADGDGGDRGRVGGDDPRGRRRR